MMIKKYLSIIKNKTSISEQEAWWLLEHITQKTKEQLMLKNNLEKKEVADLDKALVELSENHKPLAYILETIPFLNLTIHLKPPILIPRHETEEWVAQLIEELKPFKHHINSILDIGTGSGCIALALAQAFPQAHITAIDINQSALDLTNKNARLNNIANITLKQSNLFANLTTQKFDLIVSNPPYINPAEQPNLAKQVTEWEDHQALFAQQEGLSIIKEILQTSSKFLTDKNIPIQLVIEIDQNQKDSTLNLANAFGWKAKAQQDSFGKWRTIWCKQR